MPMPTDMCWRHLSSLLILALLVPFASGRLRVHRLQVQLSDGSTDLLGAVGQDGTWRFLETWH